MSRKQSVPRINRRKPSERAAPRDSARSREIAGVLGLGAAIFIIAGLLSLQIGDGRLMGPFGRSVAVMCYAAFGLCAYPVAIAIGLIGGRLLTDRQPVARGQHVLGGALGLLSLGVLFHLCAGGYRVAGYGPGGIIGETCAEICRAVVSTAGTALLAVVGLVLAVIVATPLRMRDVLGVLGRAATAGMARAGSAIAGGVLAAVRFCGEVMRAILPERDRDEYLEQPEIAFSDSEEPAFTRTGSGAIDLPGDDSEDDDDDLDDITSVDPMVPGAPVHALEEPTQKMDAADIVRLASDEEKKSRRKKRNTLVGIGEAAVPAGGEPSAPLAAVPPIEAQAVTEDPELGSGEHRQPVIVESRFKPSDAAELKRKAQTLDASRMDYIPLGDGEYKLPPVDLLDYDEARSIGLDSATMLELSARLVQTLEHYKIKGEVTAIRPGPVVTMYEFAPAPGTRLSRIESLSDELAMTLEAERVRIVAPIPGKAVVGIEVPNRAREMVYLKEILADDAFQSGKARLPLALGKTIEGAPSVVDLAKMPHLLVAGTTGSGKSVSINSMITSMLYYSTPDDVRMIMVDPKMLELSIYEGIPHLLLPVVTDPKKANIALRWAVEEMEHRYQLLSEMRVRDIVSYNKKVAKLLAEREASDLRKAADRVERRAATDDFEVEQTGEHGPEDLNDELPKKLPFIVIIIDEFADLMMCAPKEVETSVARIAQKARAAGIHLILATQRPSVNVITGLIKANFPSRVAFRVVQKVDSRTILDQGGAEALLGSGDMLFSDRGAAPERFHGCFVNDNEIQRIVDFLKSQGKPVYNLDILKPRDEDGEGGEGGGEDDIDDDKYDMAVRIVAETQRVSISYLQRRLGIGYNRAAKLVERMEREQVVGPPDSRNVREVLISPAA